MRNIFRVKGLSGNPRGRGDGSGQAGRRTRSQRRPGAWARARVVSGAVPEPPAAGAGVSGRALKSTGSAKPRAALSARAASRSSSPGGRFGAGAARSGSASGSTSSRRGGSGPRSARLRRAHGRGRAARALRTSRRDRSRTSYLFADRSLGQFTLQDTPTSMQTRHDGPDRDVEDLRGVLVAEVAEIDQHDHVAEVVRDGRERRDDVVLRQPLDDPLLVRRADGLLELVVQEVVAFLERLDVGGALLTAATVDVEVREDPQQPRPQIRPGTERLP